VLVNVLINAAQAIPKPSAKEQRISVKSRLLPDYRVEITVSDTGVGIPPHALPQLFDPFSTSKLRGDGAGLGLAICKRILQELDGSIVITSELGAGTTVTITLPEAEPVMLGDSTPQASHRRLTPRPLRILIVEDERPIARALARMLTSHQVSLLHDGPSALELLRVDSDFDVILCDLMMPGLSGAELYRKLASRSPRLRSRFVFMTGGAVTPETQSFLETSATEVLWKPFTPASVWDCIQRVAGRAEEEPTTPATLRGPSFE
jgi:CheY-like chemotaxis protein